MSYSTTAPYDLRLFARLKQEDDITAFNELYLCHREPLMSVAYKHLQCWQKAEDIIQDIFTAFYQRRALIDVQVSVRAYLLQALKYKVLNEMRSRRVRKAHKEYFLFINNSKNDFSSLPEQKEMDTVVQDTLNALPDKCREVFILSRYQHCSNKEISAKLNISISTVEKHITKALKAMRACLQEYTHELAG